MSAVLNYDASDPDKMRLPSGVTCGDCCHINRCKAIFGHVETDRTCDWSPSRFHPRAQLGKEAILDRAVADVEAGIQVAAAFKQPGLAIDAMASTGAAGETNGDL